MRHKKVALVAPPFSGHLNPLISMGKRLRARGDDVYFITGASKVPLLESLGFLVFSVSRTDPLSMERIANTPGPVRGNPWKLFRQLKQNVAILPGIRREMETLFRDNRPDILLADFCAPVAGILSERLGIPWITTMPTPFVLESKTGTPPYFGGWSSSRHLGHRLRDACGRSLTRLMKKGMETLLSSSFRSLGLSLYRPDGSESAYSSQSILGLGLNELEFPRDWPRPFQMIGPLVENPEDECVLPDLGETAGRRAVLITLGTHLLWAKENMQRMFEPLVSSFPDVWFVFSLGDDRHASKNPIRQGNNWSLYRYLPYDPCLDRFDAVIHHGGAGIVYSCLQKRKPSLVWPLDYDQFDFAQRVQERGVGIRISSPETRSSRTALAKLLSGYGNKNLFNISRCFERYNPYDSCMKEIDRLL